MKSRRYCQRLFHFARSSGILFAREKVSYTFNKILLLYLKVMLHGRFAMTIFNATHHFKIVATLFRMVATSFQHCSAVLRKKSSLRIVPCNIAFRKAVEKYFGILYCLLDYYAAKSESILVSMSQNS